MVTLRRRMLAALSRQRWWLRRRADVEIVRGQLGSLEQVLGLWAPSRVRFDVPPIFPRDVVRRVANLRRDRGVCRRARTESWYRT